MKPEFTNLALNIITTENRTEVCVPEELERKFNDAVTKGKLSTAQWIAQKIEHVLEERCREEKGNSQQGSCEPSTQSKDALPARLMEQGSLWQESRTSTGATRGKRS